MPPGSNAAGRDADHRDAAESPAQQERLGGARVDFIANLGRRVAELVVTLRMLESEPEESRLRDELRRRLHALAAGARLLRFSKLAEELATHESMLDDIADRGVIEGNEIADLRAFFDRIPEVAWSEAATQEAKLLPPRPALRQSSIARRAVLDPVREPLARPATPQSVLVVGPHVLADALSQEIGAPIHGGEASFEVERTEDNMKAIDLARALAPDVVIVDADRPGPRELVEAFATDPLTGQTPIVVVGSFDTNDDVAPFVALGVARTLPKPVSPDTLCRAVQQAAATYVRAEVTRSPFGEVTLDALGARLAEELRRGLRDAAPTKARSMHFDLGEGSDVLAALWGAVARIRDLVTIHSEGGVRFAPNGPEGALPLAAWLGESSSAQHQRARNPLEARSGELADLNHKTIVVADDDPAVTWFLAGVLRTAGAKVHEAHDGARALDAAFRFTPDLVISDVLMPHVDGFALCRALKRDVVLRDVPVILLSWKEDLLQRVREVMHARQRVAERIASGGEVRGRLDGLTTRTLLGLSCAHRPASRLNVRDASFLYEIDIANGTPIRATQTAQDGSFSRGAKVLSSLLGVGAGRFVVSDVDEARSTRFDLHGSLDEQLMPVVAQARAAQRLLSGAALVMAERVDLAEDRLGGYLEATPEPARSLLRTIGAGASPRALITSGQAPSPLLEDVLCDAAAHGAVTGILGAGGQDLLAAAVEKETAILLGVRTVVPVIQPPLDLGPVIGTSTPGPVAVFDLVKDDEGADIEVEPVSFESMSEALASAVEKPGAALSEPVFALSAPAQPAPAVAKVVAPAPIRIETKAEAIPTLGSLTPPPVLPAPRFEPAKVAPPPIVVDEEEPRRRMRRPSAYAPETVAPAPEKPAKDSNKTMWILFAVAGIVFAVGARMSRDRVQESVPPPPAAQAAPPAQQPTGPAATSAPAAEATAEGTLRTSPILPEESPLKADDKVPQGQGLLEIVAGSSDTVYIDGTLVGNGPLVKRALAPRKEPYEVRAVLRGEERRIGRANAFRGQASAMRPDASCGEST